MQPFTFFRRPLSRTASSTPPPDDIVDELGSPSESWLLISQSHEDPRVHPSSATVACQTSTPLHSQEVPRSNFKKLFHYIKIKNFSSHQPSDQNPNFQDYIVEVLRHQNYIVFHPLLLHTLIHSLKVSTISCDLLPNHSHLQLPSVKRLFPYSQQLRKTNQMLTEPEPFSGKSSMKLGSLPNFFVRSTIQPLLINISTALLTASVLEVS